MRMTMPQIIVLNHAAWVNAKRHTTDADTKKSVPNDDDPVVYHGKRLSELNSNDMASYYSDWG